MVSISVLLKMLSKIVNKKDASKQCVFTRHLDNHSIHFDEKNGHHFLYYFQEMARIGLLNNPKDSKRGGRPVMAATAATSDIVIKHAEHVFWRAICILFVYFYSHIYVYTYVVLKVPISRCGLDVNM